MSVQVAFPVYPHYQKYNLFELPPSLNVGSIMITLTEIKRCYILRFNSEFRVASS